MEAEKRERWMRLCVEAADGQDSKRLLELISEIDRLLHEQEMRLKKVRREASKYVIEAERARLLFIRRWVQRNHKSYRILYSLKLKDTLSPTKFLGSVPNTPSRTSNPGPSRGN